MEKRIGVFEKLLLFLYERTWKILPFRFFDFQKFKYLFFGALNVGLGWVMYFIAYHFVAFDILPSLKQGDSYRVQRGIATLLNHLGGFLLLIPYFRIHFTG